MLWSSQGDSMLGPQDPQNPYAPPGTAATEWAPAAPAAAHVAPSSAPKVFGILSIIFASIVLLFGLIQSCSGLAAPVMSKVGQLAPEGDSKARELQSMMSLMATVYTAIGIQGLALTIMSALLLAIGVGQLRYREWAGRWSVYWAGLALVVLAGMVALSFLLIGPAYQKMFETGGRAPPRGPHPPPQGGSQGSRVGRTGGGVVWFV
jgi:hypothetical protein